MAKFGINDILGVKNTVSGTEKVNEYKEIWLSPYEVKPSESNFYSQEKIEELADSFLTVGQQQPTVLARVDGKFIIVSGHRRNLANIYNIERGHGEYKKVRYLYKDMTPAMLELSLLMGNACNRELTAWEKTQQAQRLREALIEARDKDGLEIKGKLRDIVAEIMNESSSNVAKMDSVNNNAAPEIKEEFRKGNLGISVAYEAAKLPLEKQKEIAVRSAGGHSVSIKEVVEASERRDRKQTDRNDFAESEEFNPNKVLHLQDEEEKPNSNKKDDQIQRLQKEENKEAVRDQLENTYTKLMQEWIRENIGDTTKTARDAICKVFETDRPQEDWTNTEWIVFTSRAIMQKADHVSREDFGLLKDILERCQKEM